MQTSFTERKLLFTLSLSILLASLGTSFANVALPAISQEFRSSFADARWVVLIYLILVTFLSLSAGHWTDRFGPRRMLLVGLVSFFAGSVFCGIAKSLWFLLISRGVQAFGGAALMVLPLALIQEKSPPEKLGRHIGWLATVSAIGTASGPSLGGIIINILNWHFIFFALSLLALINFYLAYRYLREDFSNHKNPPVSIKVMWKELMQSPFRLAQLFSNLIVSNLMMSTLVLGPYYLKEHLKISYIEVGVIMSVGPILSILTGPPSGLFVDRFGHFPSLVIALIELFLGSVAFATLPSRLGGFGYMISSALVSPGYQLFQASNSTSIMNKATPHNKGTLSGLLSLSRGLGLISGAFFMGEVFSFFSSISKPLGFEITFIMAGSFILIALLLIITQNRKEKI